MLKPTSVTPRTILVVSALVYAVTAVNSVTFFHPDEHFQVLEFAGYKLGFAKAEELPWEFGARIRPYFQSAICHAVVSLLQGLGVSDRFTFAVALRLLFSFVYGASLLVLHRSKLNLGGPTTWSLACLLLTGFQPYLAARTSSETFATSLFILGAATLVGFRAHKGPATVWRVGGSGLLLGLAFQARFQTAILTLGLLVWFVVHCRPNRVSFLLGSLGGFAMAFAAGALCDRWGYGEWCLPPVGYFRMNLLEGVASRYGTSPFMAYAYLLPANIFAPVVIPLMIALVLSWLRYPNAAITWIGLPFLLVHSLIGHKEERFLFPLIPLAIVGACVAFLPGNRIGGGWRDRKDWWARWGRTLNARLENIAAVFWRRRMGLLGKFILLCNAGGMLLLMFYPLGWRPHHQLHEWVAKSHPTEVTFVLDGNPPPSYPFFRTGPWLMVPDSDEVCEGLLLRNNPFGRPATRCGTEPRLVYSEFPGWSRPWVRKFVFPLVQSTFRRLSWEESNPRTRWYSVYELQ